MNKVKDITGNKYNKLTVIKYIGQNKSKESIWLCQCDCGGEITTTKSSIKL